MTTGPRKVQQKRSNSEPAGVVYPLPYSQLLQDIDKWEHSFQIKFLGRVALHEFKGPPKRVLDLGCGHGLWAIDCAKFWPESTVVGFDVKKIQPDLLKARMPDLALRIKWVHGNFLDPLPFASKYFDYVRIHVIGLGVPENKWQGIFEEVWRILRPGGHLQITEEDQIFPSGLTPRSLTASPTEPRASSRIRLKPLTTSSESILSQPSIDEHLLLESCNREPEVHSQVSGSNMEYDFDPRDHRRIAAAWKEMLRSRFIAQQPVSLLGFYLSSLFDKVDPLPLMHIRLPPNSGLVEREQQDDGSFDSRGSSQSSGSQMTFNAQPTPPPSRKVWSEPTVFSTHSALPTSGGALQLARRFHMIAECKDAIWLAYESLYGDSPPNHGGTEGDSTQDEFEYQWLNWVNDMTDRIGMRRLASSCTMLPAPDFGDTPPSIAWRSRCGIIEHNEAFDESDPEETSLCRTVRAFLAWK